MTVQTISLGITSNRIRSIFAVCTAVGKFREHECIKADIKVTGVYVKNKSVFQWERSNVEGNEWTPLDTEVTADFVYKFSIAGKS